jgi:hypothetical protein
MTGFSRICGLDPKGRDGSVKRCFEIGNVGIAADDSGECLVLHDGSGVGLGLVVNLGQWRLTTERA